MNICTLLPSYSTADKCIYDLAFLTSGAYLIADFMDKIDFAAAAPTNCSGRAEERVGEHSVEQPLARFQRWSASFGGTFKEINRWWLLSVICLIRSMGRSNRSGAVCPFQVRANSLFVFYNCAR